MADISNDLEQVAQIDSVLSTTSNIDSETSSNSQISSSSKSVFPVLKQYTGKTNSLITVEVDNTNNTIEAKSTTYIFEQAVASSVWIIQHNLDKYPSITVVDSAGDIVWAEPKYIDSNKLEVDFSSSFAGKAYLN